MKTLKDSYECPFSKIFRLEIEGIVCQSLESIEQGDEHGWEYFEGEE